MVPKNGLNKSLFQFIAMSFYYLFPGSEIGWCSYRQQLRANQQPNASQLFLQLTIWIRDLVMIEAGVVVPYMHDFQKQWYGTVQFSRLYIFLIAQREIFF